MWNLCCVLQGRMEGRHWSRPSLEPTAFKECRSRYEPQPPIPGTTHHYPDKAEKTQHVSRGCLKLSERAATPAVQFEIQCITFDIFLDNHCITANSCQLMANQKESESLRQWLCWRCDGVQDEWVMAARGQHLQQSTADGCSPDLFTTAVKKVKKAASTLPGLHRLAATATLCFAELLDRSVPIAAASTLCLQSWWTEVCHLADASTLCLQSWWTEVCHLAAASTVCLWSWWTEVCHLAAASTVCLQSWWTEVCHLAAASTVCLWSWWTEVCHLAAASTVCLWSWWTEVYHLADASTLCLQSWWTEEHYPATITACAWTEACHHTTATALRLHNCWRKVRHLASITACAWTEVCHRTATTALRLHNSWTEVCRLATTIASRLHNCWTEVCCLAATIALRLHRCWTELHHLATSSACACTVMGSACSAAAAIKMIGLHGVEARECVELSAGWKTTFLRAPAEDGSPQLWFCFHPAG